MDKTTFYILISNKEKKTGYWKLVSLNERKKFGIFKKYKFILEKRLNFNFSSVHKLKLN